MKPLENPENFLACGGPSHHPTDITLSTYISELGNDRLSVPTQKRRFRILVKVLVVVFVRSTV